MRRRSNNMKFLQKSRRLRKPEWMRTKIDCKNNSHLYGGDYYVIDGFPSPRFNFADFRFLSKKHKYVHYLAEIQTAASAGRDRAFKIACDLSLSDFDNATNGKFKHFPEKQWSQEFSKVFKMHHIDWVERKMEELYQKGAVAVPIGAQVIQKGYGYSVGLRFTADADFLSLEDISIAIHQFWNNGEKSYALCNNIFQG